MLAGSDRMLPSTLSAETAKKISESPIGEQDPKKQRHKT